MTIAKLTTTKMGQELLRIVGFSGSWERACYNPESSKCYNSLDAKHVSYWNESNNTAIWCFYVHNQDHGEYLPALWTGRKASQIKLHLPWKPSISALCNHRPDRSLLSVTFGEVGKVHSLGQFCKPICQSKPEYEHKETTHKTIRAWASIRKGLWQISSPRCLHNMILKNLCFTLIGSNFIRK